MLMRKKSRKRFAAFFTLLCVSILAAGNVCAIQEDADYILLYENTFDQGKGSAQNFSDENGSITYNRGGSTLDSEFNGNPGFGAIEGAWGLSAAKYTLASPLSSGVLCYSFDVSRLNRETANQPFHVRVSEKYVLYGRTTGFCGPKDNLSEWGDTSVQLPYELNKVYRAEQVYDLNNSRVHTYIDNELLSTRSIPKGFEITTIDFWLSMMSAYFDNLKIEYYKQMPMEVNSVEANAGENSVLLNMTDGIDRDSLPKAGYAVTDLFSGMVSEATASMTGTRQLTITSDLSLEEGGTYLVTLPQVKGTTGSVITRSQIEVPVGNGAYLSGLRLIDCFGESHYLSEENPAEVKTLALWFSESADGITAAKSMTVTNSTGKSVAFTAGMNPENSQEVIVKFEGYLNGSDRYILSLNSGLDRGYEIPVVTAEGRVAVSACSFADASGAELGELASLKGSEVTITMSLIKTLPSAQSVLASYSLWNGLDLNSFDYKIVQLAENESEKTVTFTVPILEKQDAQLKAFLWKGLGEINPLGTEFVIQ